MLRRASGDFPVRVVTSTLRPAGCGPACPVVWQGAYPLCRLGRSEIELACECTPALILAAFTFNVGRQEPPAWLDGALLDIVKSLSMQTKLADGRPLKRIGRTLAKLALAGALGGALLLALLWLEHNRSLELPSPTGPFAVGRVSAAWVDAGRVDPFASSPGQKRELVAWLWYPGRPRDPSTAAEYNPSAWQRALAAHSGVALTQFLSRNPSKIRAHSSDDARLAPDRPTYPVIILKSGIGALALDYTTIAEDLASHGYVVVGSDTPYSTSVVVMPDGRVIHKTTAGNPGDAPIAAAEQERLLQALIGVWSADATFLVDQLARLNADDPSGRFSGRLDLGAIGVVGHSFGGAAAAQFCHDDARCRAGMDIDGALYGSVV